MDAQVKMRNFARNEFVTALGRQDPVAEFRGSSRGVPRPIPPPDLAAHAQRRKG